jgi:hypothetical protein
VVGEVDGASANESADSQESEAEAPRGALRRCLGAGQKSYGFLHDEGCKLARSGKNPQVLRKLKKKLARKRFCD